MSAPVTLSYALALGLMMAVLSIRVPVLRGLKDIPWGDGGDPNLATAIRVFGNFTEYVPMALVLLLLLESSGTSTFMLHVIGGLLLAGRLVHAVSLKSGSELSIGRKAGRGTGAMLTWTAIAVAVGTGLWQAMG